MQGLSSRMKIPQALWTTHLTTFIETSKKIIFNFPHCNLCPLSLPYHRVVNIVSCYLIHPSIINLFPGNQILGSGSISCCRSGRHVPFLLWPGLSIQTGLLYQLSCRDAAPLSHSTAWLAGALGTATFSQGNGFIPVCN